MHYFKLSDIPQGKSAVVLEGWKSQMNPVYIIALQIGTFEKNVSLWKIPTVYCLLCYSVVKDTR